MGSKKTVLKLANVSDIRVGKAMTVLLPDGKEIALFNIDGEIYALDNACPHMGGPLGEGDVENSIVTCPWHGWQFDVRTGGCQNMPGDDATSLRIEVRDGEVFLGD